MSERWDFLTPSASTLLLAPTFTLLPLVLPLPPSPCESASLRNSLSGLIQSCKKSLTSVGVSTCHDAQGGVSDGGVGNGGVGDVGVGDGGVGDSGADHGVVGG